MRYDSERYYLIIMRIDLFGFIMQAILLLAFLYLYIHIGLT